MKLQWRLFLIVAISTVIMITGLNLLIGASLRNKDIAVAKRNARQTALLIRSGLLSTMINTGEYDKIARLLDDMQKDQKFEFRMVRSEHVIKQHGMKRDEKPHDDLERMALRTGDVIESQDTENIYRIIFPFITDERCGRCHLGLDGEPTPPGIVNGLAVIKFDLTEQRRESASVITKMALIVTASLILLALVILAMIYTTVTQPMQQVAEAITKLREERYDIELPNFTTSEIKIVADEVVASAKDMAERKKEREELLERERARTAEIRKFVRSRAEAMGLEDNAEVSIIIERLSHAVDEAEKADLMVKAFKYVTHGESRLTLPSDPDLIPAVSLYLGEMMESTAEETVKRRSIELALDEALSNAIYHGNLDIPSGLKEDDFESFNELVSRRVKEEPYASRVVDVTYEFDKSRATFVIEDQGKGFNWRGVMSKDADTELLHGRGLLIINTLAGDVKFNDKGNRITISFDLNNKTAASA